jgi:uncharacterized hydrophobic protein (TIGR00271 family)
VVASIVIVVEQESLIGQDLRWPLRIAKMRRADFTLLVVAPKNVSEGTTEIDLSAVAEQPAYQKSMAERMYPILDTYLGEWIDKRPQSGDKNDESDSPPQDRIPVVKLQLVESRLVEDVVRRVVEQTQSNLVIYLGGAEEETREAWMGTVMSALRTTPCPLGVVIPGTRQDDGPLLVATGRGPHGRAAINFAGQLAAETDRDLTALYVEAEIGPDAAAVGRRILDRLLNSAREDKSPTEATKRVAVHNDPAKGILKTCREQPFEVLVLGATRRGALGDFRQSTVPNRVFRSNPEATLIVVRSTVPLRRQVLRWLEARILRRVPQLARDGRIALVERIQSNAQWNFDFVLLIALSTIIAALGLLDNSPAVIIGAMLVAPLMTPLLGLGLAIAQGNWRLAQMTLKATLFGFATAFALAVAIGLLAGEFRETTYEMDARDWPQMLDLVVAFISGIAAAYASGRPGLVSALPGVAIAAALLPPVATSGLAMSIGDFDLAFGALLLFAVNMLAIVLAAALTLRAVGIREAGTVKRKTRIMGRALILATIATAVALIFAPPNVAPKQELVSAVQDSLSDEYRLRQIRLRRQPTGHYLQIDIGGSRLPDRLLQERLRDIARVHLGEYAGVRLSFQYEVQLH